MSVTSNMSLTLPTVSVTLGTAWATQLNAALEVVDAHDHSSGKGIAITPAGLNINSDLDFESNRAIALKSTAFTDQVATLTGASNASSVYSKDGDLWYTNGSGVAVQLTDGSATVTVPSSPNKFQFDAVNTSLTPIGPADTYVVIDLDCSAARTIDLPAASAVDPGRIYMIHDATGESEDNNITINPDGSDTIDNEASLTVNSNYATVFLISNGVNKWSVL